MVRQTPWHRHRHLLSHVIVNACISVCDRSLVRTSPPQHLNFRRRIPYYLTFFPFFASGSFSLLLFDWRTLAVIQAFACLSISVFVNLALLQSPELYGLSPDGNCPSPPSHISLTAAAHKQCDVELDGVADSRSAATSHATCSSCPQPTIDADLHSAVQCTVPSAGACDSHAPGSDPSANHKLEGLTVRESLRRPIFWLIVLSIFFIDVLWGGFNLHFVSVLEDQGLGRTSGASTFLATSIAAALSSLLCGPFFDRLPVGMKVGGIMHQSAAKFLLRHPPLFILVECFTCVLQHRGIAVATGCGVLTLVCSR